MPPGLPNSLRAHLLPLSVHHAPANPPTNGSTVPQPAAYTAAHWPRYWTKPPVQNIPLKRYGLPPLSLVWTRYPLVPFMLRSDPTPTFSHSAPSIYTPSYEAPDTWDCITVVSDFPDVIPAHPLDILPRVAPEPVTLCSLMRRWPYTTHRFTDFCPRRTDGDPSELWLAPRGHFTHAHTLEHSTFC
jgi:hypothetical protein